MDVTKENFAAVLLEVTASIEQCSFIAFDTEFTGLLDGVRLSWADLPQERYLKLRQGASRFVLMQFGLCLFSQDQDGKYHVTPYKFYLFHSTPHRKLDRIFTCQVSSLSMLGAHGMDFNKWIREGIPYLSETEEQWWKEKKGADASDGEPGLNSGFLQLIKTIAKANKPLVGHNCILDLLHMHTHFIGPLPELLVGFKMELHKWFPCIYDTKVIAMQSELQSYFLTSSLPDLYSRVRSSPFPQLSIELPDSCSHYKSGKSSAHEAPYDAYITGYCMLAMSKLLGETHASGGDLLSAVTDHKNRIYLSRCEGMMSLHLAGTDPPVSREHVFLMTFPQEMTTDDIQNLFSPFGGARVCWINSTSAHIIMTRKEQAHQAFASLTSLGAVSGMKFVLAPSHPSSPLKNQDKYTPQKRMLEQDSPPPSHPSKAARLFEDCSDW